MREVFRCGQAKFPSFGLRLEASLLPSFVTDQSVRSLLVEFHATQRCVKIVGDSFPRQHFFRCKLYGAMRAIQRAIDERFFLIAERRTFDVDRRFRTRAIFAKLAGHKYSFLRSREPVSFASTSVCSFSRKQTRIM